MRWINRFEKIRQAIIAATRPSMGNVIREAQKERVCQRLDGRSVEELAQQDGLSARLNAEQLDNLSQDDIERYQEFNDGEVGMGVFVRGQDVDNFIEVQGQTADQSLHVFVAPASSMHTILDKGNITTPSSKGHENEHLVIQAVPLTRFLASSPPKDRTQFLANASVPNAMHAYNQELPATLKKEDLTSEEALLSWLKSHKCDKAFETTCKSLFTGDKVGLDYKKFKSPVLIDAIDKAVTKIKLEASQVAATVLPIQNPSLGVAAQHVLEQASQKQMKKAVHDIKQSGQSEKPQPPESGNMFTPD